MGATTLPKARTEGLLVTCMDNGETVVYDRDRDKVHCLNPTVAEIWKACDGSGSVTDVAMELHRRHGLPANQDVVELGLRQLYEAHLLQAAPAASGVSRRQLLERLGTGAALAAMVPVVTTILAPTPAQAASCNPPGASCTSGYQCCSGACVNNQCL